MKIALLVMLGFACNSCIQQVRQQVHIQARIEHDKPAAKSLRFITYTGYTSSPFVSHFTHNSAHFRHYAFTNLLFDHDRCEVQIERNLPGYQTHADVFLLKKHGLRARETWSPWLKPNTVIPSHHTAFSQLRYRVDNLPEN